MPTGQSYAKQVPHCIAERLSSPDGAGSERGLREGGWDLRGRQTRPGAPVGVQRFVLPRMAFARFLHIASQGDSRTREFIGKQGVKFKAPWLRMLLCK